MQILTRPLPCLELSLSQFLRAEARTSPSVLPRAQPSLARWAGTAAPRAAGWAVGGVAVGERGAGSWKTFHLQFLKIFEC